MLTCCAIHPYRALSGFLHGHVLDELQELAGNPPVLAACDGAAELERGPGILLTGLTTIPTRQAKPGRPPASGHPADLPGSALTCDPVPT
jgi:hypothetical protein